MTDGPEPADDPPRQDGHLPTGGRSPREDQRPDDGQPSNEGRSPTDGQPPSDDADHWVYVLRCADGTLYTGYTTDVERRVAEHDGGEGAKYTRGRTPVELVHAEGFETRPDALSREYEIKSLSRRGKERLIE